MEDLFIQSSYYVMPKGTNGSARVMQLYTDAGVGKSGEKYYADINGKITEVFVQGLREVSDVLGTHVGEIEELNWTIEGLHESVRCKLTNSTGDVLYLGMTGFDIFECDEHGVIQYK